MDDIYNSRILEFAGNIPRTGLLEDADAEAVAPLYTMVRDGIVPQAAWEKLQGQRQQYEEEYLAKEGQ